jgi:hypothetical protein
MASTPPGANTPPLHYPAATGRVGHRLHAAVIALVIAVVVVIAAAVTALVVFTRGPATSTPPPAGPAATHPAGFSAHTARTPLIRLADNTTATTTPVTLMVRPVTFTIPVPLSTPPITIGNGITLTPAPGWTVYHQKTGFVHLLNADKTVDMQVGVYTSNTTDVTQALTTNINASSATSGGIFSNMKLGTVSTDAPQGATNFQQEAYVAFTADESTQQGTSHDVGTFRAFMNTSSRLAAFIVVAANDDAGLQAGANDYLSMCGSML